MFHLGHYVSPRNMGTMAFWSACPHLAYKIQPKRMIEDTGILSINNIQSKDKQRGTICFPLGALPAIHSMFLNLVDSRLNLTLLFR